MHISWLGLSAFKLEMKDAVLVTDPFPPQATKKPLRAKAEIVTVSDPDDAMRNALSGIQGEPFVIDHPGEFEVKGVFLRGRQVPDRETGHGPIVFTLDVEGMRLAHLGGLRAKASAEMLEWMDAIDVLFLPVGGGAVLDAETAAAVMNDIEPRMVIPMHFADSQETGKGALAHVSPFLKEMGVSNVSPVDRLILKKRDLPTEETRVVVFA